LHHKNGKKAIPTKRILWLCENAAILPKIKERLDFPDFSSYIECVEDKVRRKENKQ